MQQSSLGRNLQDSGKLSAQVHRKPAPIIEELKSEKSFAVPLVQEAPTKEKPKRNPSEEHEKQPHSVKLGSNLAESIVKPMDLARDREADFHWERKMKGALNVSMILLRRSAQSSSFSRKAAAWIRWVRWILLRERELMNNEFNDINILLSEMVCRENQRIMGLRLKKNDMDSRISLLNQMLTCLKVNIFQKNLKKIKGA